jgi:hypothetical protein
MEQDNTTNTETGSPDMKTLVRSAIEEFLQVQHTRNEPAYKAELVEERKRREQLERRLNELVEENRRSRAAAEEMERATTIRSELQRLGVGKIDLAFKAVRDDIQRSEDGRLVARTTDGEFGMKEYLSRFVADNPELLPSRIHGGSGAGSSRQEPQQSPGMDLDKIRPGMSEEDLDRVRQEIARVARQTLRGL